LLGGQQGHLRLLITDPSDAGHGLDKYGRLALRTLRPTQKVLVRRNMKAILEKFLWMSSVFCAPHKSAKTLFKQ
jgi:hypothetical protein